MRTPHALSGSEIIKKQANPEKIQAIMLRKSGFENCKSQKSLSERDRDQM